MIHTCFRDSSPDYVDDIGYVTNIGVMEMNALSSNTLPEENVKIFCIPIGITSKSLTRSRLLLSRRRIRWAMLAVYPSSTTKQSVSKPLSENSSCASYPWMRASSLSFKRNVQRLYGPFRRKSSLDESFWSCCSFARKWIFWNIQHWKQAIVHL